MIYILLSDGFEKKRMTKMDENQQWAHEELKKLMKNSPTYEDQAFYRALEQLMLEQAQRLVNAAGELDGRSWANK